MAESRAVDEGEMSVFGTGSPVEKVPDHIGDRKYPDDAPSSMRGQIKPKILVRAETNAKRGSSRAQKLICMPYTRRLHLRPEKFTLDPANNPSKKDVNLIVSIRIDRLEQY